MAVVDDSDRLNVLIRYDHIPNRNRSSSNIIYHIRIEQYVVVVCVDVVRSLLYDP